MSNVRAHLIFLFLILALTAGCGKSNNGHISAFPVDSSQTNSNPQGQIQINDQGPEQHIALDPVVPSQAATTLIVPTSTGPLIVKVKDFIVNRNTKNITLVAEIDGIADANLTGQIDPNLNQAHLLSTDKSVEAFAVCKTDDCISFIVTIYKNRNGNVVHSQFQTEQSEDPSTGVIPGPVSSADADSTEESEPDVDDGEYVAPPSTLGTSDMQRSREFDPITAGEAIGPHYCKVAKNKDGKKYVSSCGHLKDGQLFPASGPGFQRKVGTTGLWATDHLIDFITKFLKDLNFLYPSLPPFLIGDSSLQKGWYFKGHVSHSNGLDIDLCYPTVVASSNGHCNITYNSASKKFDPQFDLGRFWVFTKSIAATGKVPYIFIHPEIKKLICKYTKTINEYSEDPGNSGYQALHALYPDVDHFNHFHVRMKCATWMTQCRDSAPPKTKGTGC